MAINFPDNRDQLVPPQPSGDIQTGDVYVYQGTTYTATVLADNSVRWDAAVSAGSDAYVLKVGDTMTGQLTLPGGGTGSEAATVDQITNAIPAALWNRAVANNQGTLSPATATDNLEVNGDGLTVVGRDVGVGMHPNPPDAFGGHLSVADTISANGNVQVGSLNSAGLGRSLIINGGFAIWQRGTNGGGVGYQTADRWRLGSNAPNLQRVFPPDADGIPCGVAGRLTGGAGGAVIRQAIELPEQGRRAPFVEGTQWTLSWYSSIATQTAADVAMRFSDDSAGTNQTEFTESDFKTIETLASGWTRYSVTYTAPAGFNGSNACVNIQIAGPNDGSAVDLTGIQLEPGPVATPYVARATSQELAMCQRYYVNNGNDYQTTAKDANNLNAPSQDFPVPMRASPTVIVIAAISAAGNQIAEFSSGATPTYVTDRATAISRAVPTGYTVWSPTGQLTSGPALYRWSYTADAEL